MEAARPAHPADLARVGELRKLALDELAPQRGGAVYVAREARDEDEIFGALEHPERCLWVGTIDEVVVGYAAVRVEELRSSQRLGVVDGLFVEDGARAVGVGEALMEAVVAWCAAKGCTGIDAIALPGMRETKNFFEESGFTARLLVMHHKLG